MTNSLPKIPSRRMERNLDAAAYPVPTSERPLSEQFHVIVVLVVANFVNTHIHTLTHTHTHTHTGKNSPLSKPHFHATLLLYYAKT